MGILSREYRQAIKLIQCPKLIVEVLSPSNETDDRERKFTHYRTLTTLQEYVLIDSERISVEYCRRGEGRLWLYTPYTTGDEIILENIGLTCAIELLYADVQLAQ